MKSTRGRNGSVEILIAEDSPTQAEQLKNLLEGHGYRVVAAANGRKALEALRRHRPSLVISDIVMPEMNGYELCHAIKGDEALRDIPVILVTTLSDVLDIMKGLECGADNFIRKPYEEKYLLARVDYLLMNQEMRKSQKMQIGMEIHLGGQRHFITAERQQIVDLLISVYEEAIHLNEELKAKQGELADSNRALSGLYHIAEGLNHAVSEREVCERTLEHALELPGVRAGWISLREGESGFRIAAARNLPPALQVAGAMDGLCECRRRLLAGELDHVTNLVECERLGKAAGDTQGLRHHASVPLWNGDQMLGVMNLVGADQGLFREDELETLYSVGHQVAIALERARLHEHLERLVAERTAALHASEARLRAIIEAEPECVKVVDEDGRLVQMNAAGLAMIEADSLEQVQGGKISEFVVASQRDAYRTFVAGVLDGKSAVFEFEIVGLKGTRRWLESHAVPLPEQQGDRLQMLAITRDITERKRIQEEQARLVAIIEATPDFVATGDLDGHALYINQAGLRMLGYAPEQDVSKLRVGGGQPDWALKLVLETGIPHAIEHGTWNGETAFLRPDGKERPVLQVVIAHKRPDGSVEYLSTIARDITERKANEARIVRLNRIYSVLSGINTTIVRVREPQELFDEACRIAVEHGKFTFAWIGTFDADTQQVTPVATAGRDDGYLSRINLSVAEDAPGNCPLTAEAITQAKPVICNDIASDDGRCARCAWRAEALQRGYRSVVVFPLLLGDRPVGVFVLYAPEAGVFDEEEMRLLVEMADDISFALDNLEKERRLNYLAYYDAVTGLPNRTLFLDRVTQKIHAARREGKVFSVIMLDLNRFSSINETLGRQAGDDVLRQVTRRLRGMLGETDILAHFSADYFGIATRHDDGSVNIVHVLEKVLSEIQNHPFLVSGQELRISARAGVASYPADGQDIEALFHNAESALKKAKLSGDKYLFYTPAFNALVAEKLSLENKLRRALEREELVLYYQPKVDLDSG
ncbi:MAG: GAF domain-containing protein [Thiobacillus sp.]